MSDNFLVKQGDKAEWGVPEGYPYKESNKTVIEWDGNAEGLETFGGDYYKVSDKVFTEAELIGSVASIYNYTTGTRDVELTDNLVSDGGGGTVTVITDGGNVPSIISSDGTSITAGTYFLLQDDSYIAKLIYGAETTHPISSDFLPLATPTTAGAMKQAAAVANVTAAPTAEEFNALLKSLRDAGILATS